MKKLILALLLSASALHAESLLYTVRLASGKPQEQALTIVPGTYLVFDGSGNITTKSDLLDEKSSYVALIPRTGNLWGYGDSQTAGNNSAYPGGMLPEALRWPNVLATTQGRSLTVANMAVGAQRISWDGEFYFSAFNQMGYQPINWTGTSATMIGWNNNHPAPDDAYFERVYQGHRANIARQLIEGYGGISFLGWSDSSPADGQYSWTTTGVNNQFPSSGGLPPIVPFPRSGENSMARYRTLLGPGNYARFTLANKRAIALFFDATLDSGTISVKVNGVEVGQYSLSNSGSGVDNDTGQYPYVVWLENVPASAQVEVSPVGASYAYFLAFGWVNSSSSVMANRTILYGSVVANLHGHTESILYRSARAAQMAVASFKGYPVYFANTYSTWRTATDQEPSDLSHLTPVGNQHVAQAFASAVRLPFVANPNFVDLAALLASNFSGTSSGTNTGDQYGGVTASVASQYLRRNATNTAYEYGVLPVATTSANGLSQPANNTDLAAKINTIKWISPAGWNYLLTQPQAFTGAVSFTNNVGAVANTWFSSNAVGGAAVFEHGGRVGTGGGFARMGGLYANFGTSYGLFSDTNLDLLASGGTINLVGNILGTGTSNTLPNQTFSTGAHIATRDLGDGRWVQQATVYRTVSATVGAYVEIGRLSGNSFFGGEIQVQNSNLFTARYQYTSSFNDTGGSWVPMPDASKTLFSGGPRLEVNIDGDGPRFRLTSISGTTAGFYRITISCGDGFILDPSTGTGTTSINSAPYAGGALGAGDPAPISLTSDNQALAPSFSDGAGYCVLSSDNATASNRTFLLPAANHNPGKILILQWSGANAGELIKGSGGGSTGFANISADWVPGTGDTLTLISTIGGWFEISRSNN